MNIFNMFNKTRKYSFISFDIFDTLIERNVIYPSDIFYNVGMKLYRNNTKALNFKKARIIAERKARKLSKTGEVTIFDIYENISSPYYSDRYKYLQSELAMEIASCRPRIKNLEFYHCDSLRDKKKILISDMYLPRTCIETILKKCGVTEYAGLYISCEYGCNKITGGLFQYVINDLKIEKNEIIHYGDSFKADLIGAFKVGIVAHLVIRNHFFKRLFGKLWRRY